MLVSQACFCGEELQDALIKVRMINIHIHINILEHFAEKQILNKFNSIILHLNEKDFNFILELRKFLIRFFLVFLVRYPETFSFFLLIILSFSILFQT